MRITLRVRRLGIATAIAALAVSSGATPGATAEPPAIAAADAAASPRFEEVPLDLDPTIVPVVPARLLDPRPGEQFDTVDGAYAKSSWRIGPRAVQALRVVARGGVPWDATSVVLNLTVTGALGDGYVTAWPCDEPRPETSTINYRAGQIVSNPTLVGVGEDGRVCLFSLADVALVVDVMGYVPPFDGPVPVTPARLLDTRPNGVTVDGGLAGDGALSGGTVIEVQVTARGGVPTGATAAMLNVTVVSPDGPGFATVYRCDRDRPGTSNINYAAGRVVANGALSELSESGRVCVYTLAAVDLVVDVTAYVPDGNGPAIADPARLMDSRAGGATVDDGDAGVGELPLGTAYELQVTGRAGVADGADAALLNVAAVAPSGPGFVTVSPCDEVRPGASNLNFLAGQTTAGSVLARLDPDGTVCLFTSTDTHLVVDVVGSAEIPTAPPLERPANIAAGDDHTCAIRPDGTVVCWGDDTFGQLEAPPGTFTQISAAGPATCGLRPDGSVECWGNDGFVPIPPAPAGSFAEIDVGASHVCGLRAGGSIECWGDVDIDDLRNRSDPPAGDFAAVAASASLSAHGDFDCALRTGSGVVECWSWDEVSPLATGVGEAMTYVVPAENAMCGIRPNGAIGCWGEFDIPPPPAFDGTAVQISAGDGQLCAIRPDATVDCFPTPGPDKPVAIFPQLHPPDGAFTAIASGSYHTCGVRPDASVDCWGHDDVGQSTPPPGLVAAT